MTAFSSTGLILLPWQPLTLSICIASAQPKAKLNGNNHKNRVFMQTHCIRVGVVVIIPAKRPHQRRHWNYVQEQVRILFKKTNYFNFNNDLHFPSPSSFSQNKCKTVCDLDWCSYLSSGTWALFALPKNHTNKLFLLFILFLHKKGYFIDKKCWIISAVWWMSVCCVFFNIFFIEFYNFYFFFQILSYIKYDEMIVCNKLDDWWMRESREHLSKWLQTLLQHNVNFNWW